MEATQEVLSEIGEIGLVDLQIGGLLRHLESSMSESVVYLSPFMLIAICDESG